MLLYSYGNLFLGFWVGLTGRSSLEVAFANYRFWMSSGMAIGFFITRFITVKSYLAFSFVLLLIAIFCYFVTEIYNPVLVSLLENNLWHWHLFRHNYAKLQKTQKRTSRLTTTTKLALRESLLNEFESKKFNNCDKYEESPWNKKWQIKQLLEVCRYY